MVSALHEIREARIIEIFACNVVVAFKKLVRQDDGPVIVFVVNRPKSVSYEVAVACEIIERWPNSIRFRAGQPLNDSL
jgi:hypothetical protein